MPSETEHQKLHRETQHLLRESEEFLSRMREDDPRFKEMLERSRRLSRLAFEYRKISTVDPEPKGEPDK
jgi:hypothetical protein